MIELANMHPRVNILQPGPGVGGHCLPVDPWFLVQENKAKTGLLRVARQINDERPGMIVGKLKKMVGRVKEPKIAVLGVSYKGDVDDVRESPAVEAMKQMDAKKMNVAKTKDFFPRRSARCATGR